MQQQKMPMLVWDTGAMGHSENVIACAVHSLQNHNSTCCSLPCISTHQKYC